MPRALQGVLPIAHTPFTTDDEIDYASLQKQVDWALQVGADGICTGMVSELLRLTHDERLELTDRLAACVAGRGTVVMSVGAESVKQATIFTRRAAAAGCDAVMAVPPISCGVPDSELLHYYSSLADCSPLPVIVQDASGYVGKSISIDVQAELLRRYGHDKILFKPEASPIGPLLSELRDRTAGQAKIYEGSGGILLVDSFRRGIAGTMPGMEYLDAIVLLWQALQRGDDAAAYRLYFPVCALVALQLQAGLDGFLAIEKYILHRRGLFATDLRRRPNAWSLDAETQAEIDRLLAILAREVATCSPG
jgi:4-hydroxy-tetrahydrodipicolinate synthase